MEQTLSPNPGKNKDIVINGTSYARFPLRTHTVLATDTITDIVTTYAKPYIAPGDMLFISERIVAITQGRAFPIKDIHPGFLANLLVKFVHKSPYGIGLGSPWTMELAIREAGAFRILLGTVVAAVTKPFGVKGMFYRVVGKNINAIDGPCDYTLPPFNEYAKLGPKDPDKVAKQLKDMLGGNEVIIIDANDLGVNILGRSDKTLDEDFLGSLFKDNPLGQTTERTPMAVVRRLKD